MAQPNCSDCLPAAAIENPGRRKFLGGAAALALAGAGAPLLTSSRAAAAPGASQETLVTQLFNGLSEEQRRAVCFGWDHPRRLAIANNWHIVPQKIGSFYNREQQALIMEIFKSAHAEEWLPKRLKQIQDDGGGIQDYSIAMFGIPGAGPFEWVITGRHLTLRVDGNSEPGVAFGGPIFYGHAAESFNEKPDHPGNVYWYQGLRANEVFKALDGKQRAAALVSGPVPTESPATLLSRPRDRRPGIPVEALTRDQKELVEKVLADLLAPCNPTDRAEAQRYIQANGGVNSLNLAYYQQDDIGNDGVWDVWRLEGPTMVWYFRGHPHVHTWVYVAEKPLTRPHPAP